VVLGSLGLYLGSRAAGFLAVLASTWLAPTLKVKHAYLAWDSAWYLRIAQHWYPSTLATQPGGGNQWAFFPAFPLVIRATRDVTHLSYDDAAILAAWILGGTAAIAVGLFIRDVLGSETALKAVALFVFFPASYILNVAYTEGLLLTVAALCLLCIYRERWVWAAVLANVACLTKEAGVVLVVAIAAEALRPGRSMRSRAGIIGAAVGASAAFVGWCLYGLSRTGHLLPFVTAQKAWGGRFVWFKTPFRAAWLLVTTRAAWHQVTYVAAAAALVIVAVGFVYLIRLHLRGDGVPPSWWAYSIGGSLVTFSPFWATSVIRYSLVTVPVFAAAFAHLARRRLMDFTIGAFGIFQGVLAIVVFVGLVDGHALMAP
jgi:hypothetical protein